MKQPIRLLVRPKQFFSQLQWSTHHGLLLLAFAIVAIVETQVGREQALFQILSQAVEHATGLSAVWSSGIVAGLRLGLLFLGAFLVGQIAWYVGVFFGRRSSQRVLFRRLSVVFTVMLAGYVAHQLMAQDPRWVFLVVGAYLWSALLAYFAIREQFSLSHLETMVVGALCLLAIATGWHYSRQATSFLANEVMKAQNVRAASAPSTKVAPAPVARTAKRKTRRH